MSQKFSVRVNDPKGFSRAFKLAAGCASHGSKWGNKLPVEHVLLRVAGFKALLLATDLAKGTSPLTWDLPIAASSRSMAVTASCSFRLIGRCPTRRSRSSLSRLTQARK